MSTLHAYNYDILINQLMLEDIVYTHIKWRRVHLLYHKTVT